VSAFWQKNKTEIVRLRDYNSRLKLVISELLSKANELDQECSYKKGKGSELSESIVRTCQQLITLADSVELINRLMNEGNLKDSRRDLLATCHAAEKISKRLVAMKQQFQSQPTE